MAFEFNEQRYANHDAAVVGYFRQIMQDASQLTPTMIESLACLIEEGPLESPGCLPDRSTASLMVSQGLCVEIAHTGREGWLAATMRGVDVYMAYYGDAGSLREAKSIRIAQEAIAKASH